MKKQYKNDEITIHWHQSKCKHAAICSRTLPQVYNSREKPWVKIKNASSEELRAQISKCPTGALSFTENEKK